MIRPYQNQQQEKGNMHVYPNPCHLRNAPRPCHKFLWLNLAQPRPEAMAQNLSGLGYLQAYLTCCEYCLNLDSNLNLNTPILFLATAKAKKSRAFYERVLELAFV